MKASFAFLGTLLLAIPALSGCTTPEETGTFTLLVSDEENAIGDFRTLTVHVTEVALKVKGKDNRTLRTLDSDFDLVLLKGTNTTTLAEGEAPVGEVERVDILISEAKGTLQNGTNVTVQVPSGRIFMKGSEGCMGAPKVEKGQKTEFVLDVTVVKEGGSGYKLKPNASKSGAKACNTADGDGHGHNHQH